MKYLIILFSFLVVFTACDKKEYTEKECEIFAMRTFKGLPKETLLFKKHCQGKKLKYDTEICAKALNDLILVGDEYSLKKKYGDGIMNCFTINDVEKWLKTPAKKKATDSSKN